MLEPRWHDIHKALPFWKVTTSMVANLQGVGLRSGLRVHRLRYPQPHPLADSIASGRDRNIAASLHCTPRTDGIARAYSRKIVRSVGKAQSYGTRKD
ncbi:hypothetical protein BAUCODRAFT_173712 [Baudoinia panamericana UAMH 10762]|uniref:Uncharacterized protein n=1 Tax=Baudoinia panamericana (strain UAMH 10762) TaxID=717646 RepID=M2NM47_BAUPA|nr:uncharacterized protein BAUCODRAFT_173712 [Baudoinia panamericana UAMH 10762]EMD00570.1 hypothetical protein BAUCODRAFT_173712 [Baudoinia panamericana UAMH 10762]